MAKTDTDAWEPEALAQTHGFAAAFALLLTYGLAQVKHMPPLPVLLHFPPSDEEQDALAAYAGALAQLVEDCCARLHVVGVVCSQNIQPDDGRQPS